MYRDEAYKCAKAGACLAGCVLLASALEAALMAMAQCFQKEVSCFVSSSHAKELSRPMKDWGLSQLLLVARQLKWLPATGDDTAKLDPDKADVGDLVEVVRMVRNLVHPTIYKRDYPGQKITYRELSVTFQILDVACSSLSDRLNESLPKPLDTRL